MCCLLEAAYAVATSIGPQELNVHTIILCVSWYMKYVVTLHCGEREKAVGDLDPGEACCPKFPRIQYSFSSVCVVVCLMDQRGGLPITG